MAFVSLITFSTMVSSMTSMMNTFYREKEPGLLGMVGGEILWKREVNDFSHASLSNLPSNDLGFKTTATKSFFFALRLE